MIHIFINNNSSETLILLHGTGADEYDLLPLANLINSKANVLSFRGDVIENGINRFFKRFSIGNYDLDSYQKETKKLVNEINILKEKYQFDLTKTTVIGFSNGANIALGILKYYPETLNNYILFSPDNIDIKTSFKDLTNKNVYLSTSVNDPYSNYQNLLLMKTEMTNKNANVTYKLINGHTIPKELIIDSKLWLERLS